MNNTDYKQKIIEMVEEIDNEKILRFIYVFIKDIYDENVKNS